MPPGRLVPKGLTNFQTKLQTNHAAQDGVRITSRQRHGKIGELERTLSYQTTRASMRILELEKSCTGNRTEGSNPTLSANLCHKLLQILMKFSGVPPYQQVSQHGD